MPLTIGFTVHFAVVVFGLAIGSFLNVLIYRIPRKESIVFPASHCPACGSKIHPWDNIPVLSYLLLKGRCRACGDAISPTYPVVEAATGTMFYWLFHIHGLSARFFSDAVFGSILLAITVIDLRHMIIPDRLTIPGGIVGLLFSLAFGVKGLVWAAGGALVGLFVLFVMALVGRLLFKRESMGFGDFKLAVMTGFFLGPIGNLLAFIFAVSIGGTWGIARLAAGKTKPGDEIPFGPFIAAGCFIVLFFRKQVIALAMRYLGFI